MHDELYKKVNHIQRGMLPELLAEISHALVVSNLDEVPALRLELYGASMATTASTFKAGLTLFSSVLRSSLSSLTLCPKRNYLQFFSRACILLFSSCKSTLPFPATCLLLWIPLCASCASLQQPVIAMELAKLKSAGLSQSVFSVTAEVKAQQPATQMCKLFSRTGQCRFGAKCKFMHAPTPANANTQQQRGANRQCNFCKRVGHLEATCHFKERLLKQLQAQPAQTHTTLSAGSPAMEAASAVDLPQFLSNLNSEEDDKQATQESLGSLPASRWERTS